MKPDPREDFRAQIGKLLGAGGGDRIALFAKGRVALYAILRALDVGPGDEVILPAFTCVGVANAIIYTGARPVYVDIDPTTYTIDPAAVKAALTAHARVVLAQNTFGASADLDALTTITNGHRSHIVDDCTHGLGGTYRGRPNGAVTPVAFFSTQWTKPISTGLGGVAVADNQDLGVRLRRIEDAAAEPSPIQVAALRFLLFGYERARASRLIRSGRAAYRALGLAGLVPGSSDRSELEGVTMPDAFLTRLSPWQAAIGTARLTDLARDVARRRAIAARYTELLAKGGRATAIEQPGSTHAFLRYPLRVRDRDRFVSAGKRAGINLGDWFVSPIHPVVHGLDRWGFIAGNAPVAERVCREIVNLSTEPWQSDRAVERTIRFLDAHLELIC